MNEERKKTTKELQDEGKSLLEQGRKWQQESEKAANRLRLMAESELIEFNRYQPNTGLHRDMTIYFDKLTDEQKQELKRIDQILFDMADEVTERGGRRTLKASKEDEND